MPRMTQAEYEAHLLRTQPKPAAPAAGCDDESKLHRQIMDYCDAQWPQWPYIHSRMDVPSNVGAGVPDFAILRPGGQLLLIEAKTRTGKVTTKQAGWHACAGMVGHTVHVVRSFEEFLRLV